MQTWGHNYNPDEKTEKIEFHDIQWAIKPLNSLFEQGKLNFDDYSNLTDSLIFGDLEHLQGND